MTTHPIKTAADGGGSQQERRMMTSAERAHSMRCARTTADAERRSVPGRLVFCERSALVDELDFACGEYSRAPTAQQRLAGPNSS